MQAKVHTQIEPQVTDFHGHLVTRRVDELHRHAETAPLCQSNSLDVGSPDVISAASAHLNPTAVSPPNARPVIRPPEQLQLHPALNALGWNGEVGELNDAALLKNQSVTEPILITTNGTVLAGFGRWRLAVLEGAREIACTEYQLAEDEALQFILAHHQTRRGWNAFVRIRLALTLEPYFQQRALDNMRAGGRYKGSSNLTEARTVDVRAQIAAAANVSAGNVTKAKQLMKNATAEFLQALRNGEISIHRAWRWSQESLEKQREALWFHRSEKGVKKTIRALVRRQQSKNELMVVGLGDLTRQLSTLQSSSFGPIRLLVIEVPERTVVLSEDLFHMIGLQRELPQ